MKRFLIVIFLSFLCGRVFSQGRLDSLYFKSDLIADLQSLKQELLKSHPSPFEFCDERYFNKVFEASSYAIEERTALAEYTVIVSNLLNTLKDSHTAIDYGQLLDMQFSRGGFYMPLGLELAQPSNGNKLLVTQDWESKITPGSELLSINGIPVDKLLKRATDYACVEGDADEARKAVAVSILTICAGLKRPYQSLNKIEIVDFNSADTIEVDIRGYQRKEFYKERMKRLHARQPFPVQLTLDSANNLAILQVTTFAPSATKRYRKLISDCFRKVKEGNYTNLIIDLRNNGGGSSSLVEYLYSFIDTTGYNTPSNVIGRNSRLSNSRSRLMNSALGDLIMALFYARDEDVQSFRHLAQLPLGEVDTVYFKNPVKQPTHTVFKGFCYLLINGLTASAAVDFTSAFKKRNRGALIGQQCLGPITGTWGNPAAYVLPRTGLRVSIATIRYNYDDTFRYDRQGIMPDYWVGRSADDIYMDRDTPVEFVINLIKK